MNVLHLIGIVWTLTCITSCQAVPLGSETSCPLGAALYNLTFTTFWSEERFPKQYPHFRPNAQWSALIGRSHSEQFSLWRLGELALPTVQELAERGTTNHLSHQVQGQAGVMDSFTTLNIRTGVGSVWATFMVDGEHSKISAISKVVPSPDWFVGIDSLDLCQKGKWIEDTTVDLELLDAGTDKGFTFSSPNWEERPPVEISKVTSLQPSHPANSFFYSDWDHLPTIATLTVNIIRDYSSNLSCVDDGATTTTGQTASLDIEETTQSVENRSPDLLDTLTTDSPREWSEKNVDEKTGVPTEERSQEVEDTHLQQPALDHDEGSSPGDSPASDEVVHDSILAEDPVFEEIGQEHQHAPLRHPRSTSGPTAKRWLNRDSQPKRQDGDSHRHRHHQRKPQNVDTKEDRVDMQITTTESHIVDCTMGWSEWGPCSESCGYGTQVRSFGVLTEPRNGGQACPNAAGVRNEIQLCGSMKNCQWAHFSFSNWDA